MNLINKICSQLMRRELKKSDLHLDPFIQFYDWYKLTKRIKIIPFYNRMVLSTVDKQGHPSSRVVLLKSFDKNGFVFFTNYNSEKSVDIDNNSNVSILFYWPLIERQIRINGVVEKISTEDSKEYFKTRSRKSQLGAWASKQSKLLVNREDFENRIAKYDLKYKDLEVPCPSHWGGYRLIPKYYDFWQARMNRLHDRFSYTITGCEWSVNRLSP